MSLSVTNLPRSVAFYRTLFGQQPAKEFADYAKFELEDPPVVFSIIPHPPGPAGGVLSHAGFKVASHAAVEACQRRLLEAGYKVQCQEGAMCGYRRQDKIHVADPDGTQWEVYMALEDVAPESIVRGIEGPAARVEPPPGPVVWEHFITNPPPSRIAHDDASVDEVRLVGTYNTTLSTAERQALIAEARRVLRPGGKVMVHGLMADRPFPGKQPTLPGLAAMVAQVPVQSLPIEELKAAGFVGMQIARYSEKPWFRHDGVELREVKVIGWQPSQSSQERRVLYKGPFAEAVGDDGSVFPRGQRVAVSLSTWEQLRRGASAEQFLFLDLPSAADGCSA
jgi:catechol 2,3-dioxygenase-like lactoylglutathione lyase family enzyme